MNFSNIVLQKCLNTTSAASPETDAPAAKTRRTTRSKKEKTPEGSGGEAKETDTEMKETPEAVSDGVPDFPDTAAVPDTDEGEETIPQEDVPSAEAGPEETPLPSGERETGTVALPSRRVRSRKEDAPARHHTAGFGINAFYNKVNLRAKHVAEDLVLAQHQLRIFLPGRAAADIDHHLL